MNRTNAYVIYRDPSDYPGQYVVRRWTIDPLSTVPDADPLIVCGSIGAAREAIPVGLYCIGRHQGDDPKILEKWI